MTEDTFINLYWKQFLMIEKEFRQVIKYVAISEDNFDAYSDFFAKIILQIGSEVDIVAKVLCKEHNTESKADGINKYRDEILKAHPELEKVTVVCADIELIPWRDWSESTPLWWRIYNGIKHNRCGIETYNDEAKESYKFANLRDTLNALAGLYLINLYLFQSLLGRNIHIDTPMPGSRLFKPINQGWEVKNTYADSALYVYDERLVYTLPQYLYSDL